MNNFYSKLESDEDSRPTGVDILVILNIIVGLNWMGLPYMIHPETLVDIFSFGLFDISGGVCSNIFFMFGVLGFIFAFTLFKGIEWSRRLDFVYGFLSLVGFPIGTIMSILMIIYLRNSEVKNYFNKKK